MNRLPWPAPISHYDSDGPRTVDELPKEFEIAGARILVAATDLLAPTTFRDRYRVECLTCTIVLHHATTGPTCRIEQHLADVHGLEGYLDHEPAGGEVA